LPHLLLLVAALNWLSAYRTIALRCKSCPSAVRQLSFPKPDFLLVLKKDA
jgi:hypothetical protein